MSIIHTRSNSVGGNNVISTRVELGGDFDAGYEVVLFREGDHVTLTSDGMLTHHASSNNPSSAAGVIPTEYRPSREIFNVIYQTANGVQSISLTQGGTLSALSLNWSGSAWNITLIVGFTISYVITNNIP